MSILVNRSSRVVVQGITGGAGSFHAKQCMEYGTQIVAGVTPGRGGEKFEGQVPIFDTVAEAVQKTGADVSLIFVPPPGAADAILEAADAGWELRAIFHSHTHTEASPSPTDRRQAFYPDAFYLLVSLADRERPVLRGFTIVDGEVEEHEVWTT